VKRAQRTSYPQRACSVCGRVMTVNTLARHEPTHELDPRDRFLMSRDEQDAIVRAYRHRGGTLASIARDTHWSKTQVRRVLLANGVQLRERIGDHRPKISSDEALRRTELYGRGLSIADVAEACGVTCEAIRQTLKREGVKPRARGVNTKRWRRELSAPERTS
jgi:AraC-like DNA-binding protein